MKPGDVLEIAFWLDGRETEEQLTRWRTIDCPANMKETADRHGLALGPIEFFVKRPGDDRVPPVPDRISGPDVRLLVAEAKLAYRPNYTIKPASGFTSDLTKEDLATLRKLTRQAHARSHPGDWLSDTRCDQIIEALGPDVALKTLRDGAALH